MPRKKPKIESQGLAVSIIDGIKDEKGVDVVSLNLSGIKSSVCNYFVICHGTSRTHVEAIADAIEASVRKGQKEKPWHREGYENAEWILLDYVDVVAHIFQKETRDFYQLEKLWADAEVEYFDSDE